MKKKFITAMTTALVVGAASTTFAAANPFSDVPAGHWAYDAVTQLAADGIIEGYGDGTYLGNRNITRYEMAQMIAKAMAKNPSGADKAALDRLAAEFSEELSNLGVRVANLEKYSDKVTWTGELRYRYWSQRYERKDEKGTDKQNTDQLQLRLFPTAEVNDHWKLKARLTASNNMKTNTSTDFKLTYAFAEGTYDKLKVSVGKMPLYSYVDGGLVVDDFFSGAQVEYGSKWKILAEAGRWDLDSANDTIAEVAGNNGDNAANYQGVEVSYDDGNKFNAGAAYRHLRSDALKVAEGYNIEGKIQDNADIWSLGVGYKFDKNVKLFGAYAKNPTADSYDKAYNAQLTYKGADKTPGSWGAYIAYRYVGNNVAFMPTYDIMPFNKKGIDLSLQWSPLKNTLTQINYFRGKRLSTDKKAETLFARVSWFF